jgi:hypothetical protein
MALQEYALTRFGHLQIQNPSNAFEVYERSVSSGDHSFVAAHDGKYEYCFSNEHWSANSKEVSFNVHGIVYVPESEAPQDPLEKEGKFGASTVHGLSLRIQFTQLTPFPSQSSSSPNSSPKLRTSKATLSSANAPTATPPRAPTPASSGGAFSRWASSLAKASSRFGGSSASSRSRIPADPASTRARSADVFVLDGV